MTDALRKLAVRLLRESPHKVEITTRRVRALFGDTYVIDTTEARHVWEHPYFPQFYVPLKGFATGALHEGSAPIEGTDGGAFPAKLSSDGQTTDRVLVFKKGPLNGLVKVDFGAVHTWFEEDQEIYGHPKDPYKRVDILPSSRKVTVSIDGEVIAESNNVMFLLETTLPTRYYLPQTSLRWDLVKPSSTTSLCPYKGVAEYFDVTIKGKEYKDIVWWYRYPTSESAPIASRICAYNEKLDISIDGVLQERPKSKFG